MKRQDAEHWGQFITQRLEKRSGFGKITDTGKSLPDWPTTSQTCWRNHRSRETFELSSAAEVVARARAHHRTDDCVQNPPGLVFNGGEKKKQHASCGGRSSSNGRGGRGGPAKGLFPSKKPQGQPISGEFRCLPQATRQRPAKRFGVRQHKRGNETTWSDRTTSFSWGPP